MEQLFAYGTLQDPNIQQELLSRHLSGHPDTLDDFELFPIQLGRQTYPMIRPKAKAYVVGTVLDVRSEELATLDSYETTAYCRVRVTLRSGKVAWVYREPA